MDLVYHSLTMVRGDSKTKNDIEERRKFAIEILRSDHPLTPEIRNAIADLFELKLKKGAPKRTSWKWIDVGNHYEDAKTIAQIAELMSIGVSTVERHLKKYKKWKREEEEIMKEIYD